MSPLTIEELFNDKELNTMIRKLSSYNYEFELAKSEIFFILCNKPDKINKCPTKKDQLNYISDILRKQIHSNTSPFHKNWRNNGHTKLYKTVEYTPNQFKDVADENYEENKIETILSKIDEILNKDIRWYDASLFRLYYLPYKDKHCGKETYSLREIEKMHTYGKYKIDHIAVHKRVKNTFEKILYKLKEEGYLNEKDIKDIKTLKLFNKI